MTDLPDTSATPERGSVGKEVFDRVEALLSQEPGLSRSAAFERIGAEIGKAPGTVAASYYRVARSSGTTTRPARVTASGEAKALGDNLRDAVNAIITYLNRKEAEVEKLHDELERLNQIRSLLK